MLFLTSWFTLFAWTVFPLYWSVRIPMVRRAVLLGFSGVFHAYFAGPAGMLPVLVLGLLTYFAGLSRRRWACVGVSLACVASLIFYKYMKFLCLDVVGMVWSESGRVALERVEPWMPLAAPLAISFFVFEFVHYLVDVGRGEEPIHNPFDFWLFTLFWPSIVAGPVKRYHQFLPALERGVRDVCRHDVAIGLVLVAVGLLKKFAADNLTSFIQFQDPTIAQATLSIRWATFLASGFRILWDFSGYSDMAIGFALMFGIRLPRNFNWPYLAVSLTSFWRRWHMSLSSWIRDYIYIPLGGSRHGLIWKVISGLTAFAICGLWHGAATNFLVWGLYHGVGLAVVGNYRVALGRVGEAIADWFATNRIVGWLLTMLYVQIGWLFFFYPVAEAWARVKLLVPKF